MAANRIKIAYLTAGAAGMYCGSCMHDNTLVRALNELDCDVSLIPTYTPIRTDESSIAVDQVFFGGINVYLQQKIPLFRWLPAFLDRFLDNPWLIRRATSRSIDLKPAVLGKLAISMLRGRNGNQRKEVARLTRWLKQSGKPDLVVLTNLLIGGVVPFIKEQLDVPVIVTLQGDDVFLDSLLDGDREQCIELMREIAESVDGFICHTRFYREYIANYLGITADKILVTPLGLDTTEYESVNSGSRRSSNGSLNQMTIGYLARLAPEKGLHLLVDSMLELQHRDQDQVPRLLIAGWLGSEQKVYAEQQFNKLREAGLGSNFEYLGAVDRSEKLRMLEQVDVMCVPATFLEPKGLYALEAMAAGIPVVAPDHGAFPELIEATSGGLLFAANDRYDLASKLQQLLLDDELRATIAKAGRSAVVGSRNATAMARKTLETFEQLMKR